MRSMLSTLLLLCLFVPGLVGCEPPAVTGNVVIGVTNHVPDRVPDQLLDLILEEVNAELDQLVPQGLNVDLIYAPELRVMDSEGMRLVLVQGDELAAVRDGGLVLVSVPAGADVDQVGDLIRDLVVEGL